MARQVINPGTGPNTGDGEPNRSAWVKTEANFAELYGLVAGYMIKVTYDPNGHEADVFDRDNHTGTQSADTITDGTLNKAYTAGEMSKLGGIQAGATANASDAFLRARANHTGTQSADTVVDGTTNKAYTAGEKTKLSGIASGATANSSDAALRRMLVRDTAGTGSDVLLATDNNTIVRATAGGWTVPSATLQAGDAVPLYNNSNSAQTITRGSGLTLYREGARANTAGFTLAGGGSCTVIFIDANTAYIVGGSSLT